MVRPGTYLYRCEGNKSDRSRIKTRQKGIYHTWENAGNLLHTQRETEHSDSPGKTITSQSKRARRSDIQISHLQSRKTITAGSNPACIMVMQNSIFVLAGPGKL